jgi:hypothetical protein
MENGDSLPVMRQVLGALDKSPRLWFPAPGPVAGPGESSGAGEHPSPRVVNDYQLCVRTITVYRQRS